MSTDTPTATPLELAADAAAYALLAFAYPSDIQVREAAMRTCQLVGIDYVEAVASTMDLHPQVSTAGARRHLAMHLIDGVNALASKGAEPRPGILASGKPADALGRDPSRYGDDAEGWDA